MTEMYDVAQAQQQPTKHVSMLLPVGMGAVGAVAGIGANAIATQKLTDDEIRKLFQANDRLELSSKLKGTTQENIDEALKLQEKVNVAKKALEEAKNARIPDSIETKRLQRIVDEKEKELARALENATGSSTTEATLKFPKATEFPKVTSGDGVYAELGKSERAELEELIKKLKSAESKFNAATRTERGVVNGLYNPETNTGSIKTAYDAILPDMSKIKSEKELEKYITDHLTKYSEFESGAGRHTTTEGQKFFEVVKKYYDKNHKIGSATTLTLEHAKNVSSYVERETVGQAKPKGCLNWLKGKDPTTGKNVFYTYMEEDATEYLEKAEKERLSTMMDHGKDMFDDAAEYTRKQYRLKNLNNVLGNLGECDVLDEAMFEEAGIKVPSRTSKVDIEALMKQKDELEKLKHAFDDESNRFTEAIDYVKQTQENFSKFDKAHFTRKEKWPTGYEIPEGATSYEEIIADLERKAKEIKVEDTKLFDKSKTTTEEIMAQINARLDIIKKVEDEKKTIEEELKAILKKSSIYTEAADALSEKAAGTGLRDAQANFLDKFGDLKIGKKGETLAELYEGSASSSGSNSAADKIRKALEKAKADLKAAFTKEGGGKVDESKIRAAEDNLAKEEKSFSELLTKIGQESKICKLFKGQKWIAIAIGAVTLFLAGLGIRASKNKQTA